MEEVGVGDEDDCVVEEGQCSAGGSGGRGGHGLGLGGGIVETGEKFVFCS